MDDINISEIISLGMIVVIGLARIYTLVTKTNEDDKYLDKNIPKVLRIISIVFGYDLRQGRKHLPK